ncbi:MAG: recombinase RecT [Myxococcota bacterium]
MQLTKREQAQADAFGEMVRTPEQKRKDFRDLVLRTVMPDQATADELELVLGFAKSRDLDLLGGDIYVLRDRGKLQFKCTIDGMRKIAARAGGVRKFKVFWCGEDGEWLDKWLASKPPRAALCHLQTMAGGEQERVVHWEEFGSDKTAKGPWGRMSAHMLAKVAEAHALRGAFPEALGRLYTNDELPDPGQGTQEPAVPTIEAQATPGPNEDESRKRRFWGWFKDAQEVRAKLGLPPMRDPTSVDDCEALLQEHDEEVKALGARGD